MMLRYLSERRRNTANLISDGGDHFSQNHAMVLLISPERIELHRRRSVCPLKYLVSRFFRWLLFVASDGSIRLVSFVLAISL